MILKVESILKIPLKTHTGHQGFRLKVYMLHGIIIIYSLIVDQRRISSVS